MPIHRGWSKIYLQVRCFIIDLDRKRRKSFNDHTDPIESE